MTRVLLLRQKPGGNKAVLTTRAGLFCVCWLAVFGSCGAVKPREADPSKPFLLSLVGTNDLHGHIENLPCLGGHMANLRHSRENEGAVVLVDAGDMFQGTLASNTGEGRAVVEAYNRLGYDAVAIGNHEFDFGPEGPAAAPQGAGEDPRGALKARAQQAQFPFLAANVWHTEEKTTLQGANILPTTMLVKGGVRVGLIGVTTQDTPSATLARNFVGLSVRGLATTIVDHARALRAQGAHVIVVIAHAGAACTAFQTPRDISSCSANAEIFDVARALPSGLVNAIVAGHTHAGVAHEVAGIPIIEAYSYGRAFGRIDLVLDRRNLRVIQHRIFPPQDFRMRPAAGATCEGSSYEGRTVSPDREVALVVRQAQELVQPKAEQSLNTHALLDIKRAYKSESALGNLLADLMRAARPHADVAITNGGGLRQDLPRGPLLYQHLFETMPFDNTFASASITGAQLAELFRQNLQGDRGILSISGLRVQARCEGKTLVVQLARYDGRRVRESERLTLLTTDFLATGGDGLIANLEFQLEALPPVRDEMARVLMESGQALDPRALWNPDQPRMIYPGTRPVRCGR